MPRQRPPARPRQSESSLVRFRKQKVRIQIEDASVFAYVRNQMNEDAPFSTEACVLPHVKIYSKADWLPQLKIYSKASGFSYQQFGFDGQWFLSVTRPF
jgi:hypothetical protein